MNERRQADTQASQGNERKGIASSHGCLDVYMWYDTGGPGDSCTGREGEQAGQGKEEAC